jgi:hypothetical protein
VSNRLRICLHRFHDEGLRLLWQYPLDQTRHSGIQGGVRVGSAREKRERQNSKD